MQTLGRILTTIGWMLIVLLAIIFQAGLLLMLTYNADFKLVQFFVNEQIMNIINTPFECRTWTTDRLAKTCQMAHSQNLGVLNVVPM